MTHRRNGHFASDAVQIWSVHRIFIMGEAGAG